LAPFDLGAPHRQQRDSAIPPILRIVSLVIFASTLFSRAVDPVVPKIATNLAGLAKIIYSGLGA
jgi:hypothetical protein